MVGDQYRERGLPDTYKDPYSDCDTHTHSYGDSDRDTDAHTDLPGHVYCDSDSHLDRDVHRYSHSHSNSDFHADAHSDRNRDRDDNGHGYCAAFHRDICAHSDIITRSHRREPNRSISSALQ